MNKKIFIPIIILVILIGGGFFGWQAWKEYQSQKRISEMPAGEFFGFNLGKLPKGFVANEISGYSMLENEEIGISFKVPEGWEFIGYLDQYIDLKSPDFESDSESFDRIKGCKITVEVNYYTLPPSTLARIDDIQKGIIHPENEEVIKISGHDVLKIVERSEWWNRQGVQEIIEIDVPFPKAQISFFAPIFLEEGEKCAKEFNKFLEGVLIK